MENARTVKFVHDRLTRKTATFWPVKVMQIFVPVDFCLSIQNLKITLKSSSFALEHFNHFCAALSTDFKLSINFGVGRNVDDTHQSQRILISVYCQLALH